MSRTATPDEAVSGGIAALQRLGLRARLYSDELLRARSRLECASEAAAGAAHRRESERLRPLDALLREFGGRCDSLSFDLQPARDQMEEALNGLDSIGLGRAAIAHFTRGEGGPAAVYANPSAVDAFLAEHPEHRPAVARHVARATEAYARAEAARDRFDEGLERILEAVDAL